ncbi:MAG: methionine--tRNA ligase [Patescibacteria group bacterium]
MNKSFYITTALPYVNASPHIGFGLEIVTADVLARYHRLLAEDVVFNTGVDEHGQKILNQALKAGQSPQDYVDEYAQKYLKLKDLLDLSWTNFIRTTDPHHLKAATEFWRLSLKNGFIYKDQYATKYCVGCELEKTDSELVDGHCPLHPQQTIEQRDEENYFFRFSKFQSKLKELYLAHPNFILPDSKMKEMLAFVDQGLTDFSISRLKAKMPWGVPIPDDPDHVMYVWFDALINYISVLGWPQSSQKFDQFWPGVQIAGKDNLRQQSAMWQTMLMSAGLPCSKQILINGFISVEGQKMSKSLGNVISPQDMIDRYGLDATRWLLVNLGPLQTDMDVSWTKFDTIYTATLSRGLGNVCSRIAKLAEQTGATSSKPALSLAKVFQIALDGYQVSTAVDWINQQVSLIDEYLSQTKPWLMTGPEKTQVVSKAVDQILVLAHHLSVFLPGTSEVMTKHFSAHHIASIKPLFPGLTPSAAKSESKK